MSLEQSFQKAFDKTKDNSPSFWKQKRIAANEVFQSQGIPNNKNEEWKYTLLRSISDKVYNIESTVTLKDVESKAIKGLEGFNLFFLNGKLINEVEGISVLSLDENPTILEKIASQKPYSISEPFTSANFAASDNGIVIELSKSIDKPIVCNFISDASKDYSLALPQVFVHAKKGVEASFVVNYATIGDLDSFTNNQLSFYVEQNARISLAVIQHEAVNASIVANTNVIQERDSYFASTTVSTQANIIRNSLAITSVGENTESHMFGLYFLNGKTHVDNHTVIDHTQPNCFSNELFKGILDDNARGVFNGKVYVRQAAQKTNAFQSNKNILLSDDATINTKPQLEIWADDVKCSHGATTGQLDQQALFYLMARGISKKKAIMLLLNAFSSEVIDKLGSDVLTDYVVDILSERLT